MFAEKKLALAVSLKKILGEIMEVHLASTLIFEYPDSRRESSEQAD
jgi:hypothetical protein